MGECARRPRFPLDSAKRGPDLEPPTRVRQPRDRRQLRVDGHRSRPALRDRTEPARALTTKRSPRAAPAYLPAEGSPASSTGLADRRWASADDSCGALEAGERSGVLERADD